MLASFLANLLFFFRQREKKLLIFWNLWNLIHFNYPSSPSTDTEFDIINHLTVLYLFDGPFQNDQISVKFPRYWCLNLTRYDVLTRHDENLNDNSMRKLCLYYNSCCQHNQKSVNQNVFDISFFFFEKFSFQFQSRFQFTRKWSKYLS